MIRTAYTCDGETNDIALNPDHIAVVERHQTNRAMVMMLTGVMYVLDTTYEEFLVLLQPPQETDQ